MGKMTTKAKMMNISSLRIKDFLRNSNDDNEDEDDAHRTESLAVTTSTFSYIM